MVGIGIDIEEIKRFMKFHKKSRQELEKIYSQEEINYCLKKYNPAQHFAVRFAAKEAVIKAVGTKIAYSEISIEHQKDGKPYVKIKGKVRKSIIISMSHSKENAVVVAVHR